MLDIHHPRRRALAWAAALVALAPVVARAERVTDVRIGRHGDYTRVVVELDAMTKYRLERSEVPGQPPEILIKLDAGATPRVVASQSDVVQGVKLESRGDGAVARVALRTREIRLAEMTLQGPARIVLDLRKASGTTSAIDEDVASRFGAPKPDAAELPKPAPAPAPTPAKPPKPEPPVVAKAAPGEPAPLPPTVKAELEAAARGEDVIHRTPVVTPPRPAAEPVAPAAAPPADEGSAQGAGSVPPQDGGPSVAAEPTAPLGEPPAAAPPPPPPAPPIAAQPAPVPKPVPVPTPAPVIEEGGIDPNVWIAAGVVLVGFFLVLRLFAVRRRRAEDGLAGIPPHAFDDRDATDVDAASEVARAHADEDERTVGIPVPDARAESASVTDPGSLFDEEEAETDGETKPDAEAPAVARGMTLGFESDAPTIARAAVVEDDLPAVAGAVASEAKTVFAPAPRVSEPPAAPALGAAAARPPDDDLVRLLRDVERRMAQVEQRLAQAAEARERVERQIAAQTEELRVQRAAIARTQRVLRTLARPEDLATEPVPRGPGGN
jgi:hypothetical protein